jgi:hypothetical protein
LDRFQHSSSSGLDPVFASVANMERLMSPMVAIAVVLATVTPALSQFLDVEPRVQIVAATDQHRLIQSTVQSGNSSS